MSAIPHKVYARSPGQPDNAYGWPGLSTTCYLAPGSATHSRDVVQHFHGYPWLRP